MKSVKVNGKTYQLSNQVGRPKKILTENEMIKLLEERQSMTVKQMAILHGTSRATIYRYFKQIEEFYGGDNNGE